MTIILDNYTVPTQGKVELNVQFTFDLHVTSEQAVLAATRWAREEISLFMGSQSPTLVVSERPAWRTPLHITLPNQGKFDVATVDIDVLTGDVINAENSKATILQQLEHQVKPQRQSTAFTPKTLSPNYASNLHPRPQFTA